MESSCASGVERVLRLVSRRLASSETRGELHAAEGAELRAQPAGSSLETVLAVMDPAQLCQWFSPVSIAQVRAACPAFGGDARGLIGPAVINRLIDGIVQNRPGHLGARGYSSLHSAAEYGDIEGIWAHLRRGADPNEYDENGCVPLHYAADNNSARILKMLLAAGADMSLGHRGVDVRSGWAPLHFAAYAGSQQVLLVMLSRGVDVNQLDGGRRTPRYYAKSRGRDGCERLLARFGGELDTHLTEGKLMAGAKQISDSDGGAILGDPCNA